MWPSASRKPRSSSARATRNPCRWTRSPPESIRSLAALESAPAPLEAAPGQPKASRYDPIQAEEVAAFKRALADGVANPAAAAAAAVGVPHGVSARAFDGSSRHGPQSYTLLTGFEDTELPDALDPHELSGTQYGKLS